MSGSKGARASPDLIAACHVFHRLSTPRHPSEALMRLIVLSKTHVWGRYMRPGRTKGRDTPTHALCFLMSSRVRPQAQGSRTDPSIHDVFLPPPAKPGGGNLYLRDRGGRLLWWSQTGSNRRPHACKARALPTELWPRPEEGSGRPGQI